jgi:hypothetical protein
MIYKIKQFFKRIYNLYRWFPIIWKDQDWDDHYIWEILKFKLKNQSEYIGYYNRHMSAKRDAEKMMLCVRLIEKIQSEYYSCEYFEYHDLEFKSIASKDHPDLHEMIIVEKSEHYDDYFKKYPLIYKCVPDLKAPKGKIAMQIALKNEERASKLLFKILEQNIKRWWD